MNSLRRFFVYRFFCDRPYFEYRLFCGRRYLEYRFCAAGTFYVGRFVRTADACLRFRGAVGFISIMITSRQNDFVKRIASLKDKKYRTQYGEYLIEGYKQVREAFLAGKEIVHIVYSPRYKGELYAEDRAVAVSDEVFMKLSEEATPQGILAVLKIPEVPFAPPAGRCLLLDGVSDPGNLGTILRTANAAGYEDVYLRGCSDPYAPKCVRSAMSGIFFVRLHEIGDEELSRLVSAVPFLCADMDGENVFHFSAPEKFCLVIGNEANGVRREVRALCSKTVSIPMRGSCESLNAAVSAGILMYELAPRDLK